MIQCGMSEVSITPVLGGSIPGYFEERKSTGIKDELFVKALILHDGCNILALLSADVLSIEREETVKIRELINKRTGIPMKNIMICVTHTHTGPAVVNSFEVKRDEEYIGFFIRKAADAALIAFNKMKPVKLGWEIGYLDDIAFNRRYFMKDGSLQTNPGVKNPLVERPAGQIDPNVIVLRIDDFDGNPVGVLTNYACHLDVVGGTEISADYAGELSRNLKKLLGDKVVSIFLTGASGNINHIDVSGKMPITENHYVKMGRMLAGEVIKVREKANVSDKKNIDVRQAVFMMDTRKVSSLDIEKAEKALNSPEETYREKVYARQMLQYAKNWVGSVEVEVQVIAIDNKFFIAGFGGELFVEFGLDIKNSIKEAKDGTVMVVTHTNGRNGYMPLKESFDQGGYEPRTTTVNRLVPEAGYLMVEKAKELIAEES